VYVSLYGMYRMCVMYVMYVYMYVRMYVCVCTRICSRIKSVNSPTSGAGKVSQLMRMSQVGRLP
jgi:hypothetical protein